LTTCSVIICTRNQCAKLANVLDSIVATAKPHGLEWELLVVDNGSSDGTTATIDRFAARLPIVRVWEPIAGLSNARNAGVARARGRHIIWTDDDVLVAEKWLVAYIEAFDRHPDAAVFAGRVTPVLLPPTPAWFERARGDLHFLLAARDFGPDPVPLSVAADRLPFGASFAVRTVEQQQFLYDPDLGVAPGRRRGGEETAVVTAILDAGHSGWWVPGGEVKHLIGSDRQTTAYIDQFYAAMGEGWARSAELTRAPLATRAKFIGGTVRHAVARAAGHKSWVRYRSSLAFHRGVLAWFAANPRVA
jgi:glycosyltransferase involved in cell wall biosynthesis